MLTAPLPAPVPVKSDRKSYKLEMVGLTVANYDDLISLQIYAVCAGQKAQLKSLSTTPVSARAVSSSYTKIGEEKIHNKTFKGQLNYVYHYGPNPLNGL